MKPLLLMTLGCLFSAMSPVFGTQLLQIQAIWRHGDRTPSGTYPNDPYRENSWNLPFGELTTTGMWQQFQQGMKLKEEYTNKHKLINAKSTCGAPTSVEPSYRPTQI
ncbi:hypothetical protein L596_013145 [Steinernema carpocapsae]|uniref:Acid phosphatase n=1 Tax=Steinernema carpocapsae TaxID=34508 RepID=A0A4U5NZS8_STECR|nr:hypothetical protein L596_013145 [Steinernema carpocapsae]